MNRRGFTLIELMVTLTIVTVVAVLVTPVFRDDDDLRVMGAAAILASDLEYAQVLNISHPQDPVVVRFDPTNAEYWIASESSPDVAIPREDTGQPYRVRFGFARARAAEGVTFTLADIDSNTIEYDALGGISSATEPPTVVLGCRKQYITITITPQTGTIVQTDGRPDPN